MNKKKKITRRQFVKGAAIIGAAAVGGTTIIGGGKVVMDKLSRDETLARRDRARPRDGTGWLIPEEQKVLGALAALIVPSDGAPGAKEADVVNTIDRLLARSHSQQRLYALGLLGFDELALQEYGGGFTELTYEQQLRLFQAVDRTYETATTGGPSVTERLRRKATKVYHQWPAPGAWDGFDAVLQLFPRLIRDVKEAFYTSTVAWEWLGYDGPPFPRGYFGLVNVCSP